MPRRLQPGRRRHRSRATADAAIIDDLVRLAGPGLHATTGPRFHGWVIGGSHPVGVAADWLTAAWGQNAGNHIASPAAAAARERSRRNGCSTSCDLPASASVGFVTGATVANFVCLAAARGEVLRKVGWDVEGEGLFGAPPITPADRRGGARDGLLGAAVPRASAMTARSKVAVDRAGRDGAGGARARRSRRAAVRPSSSRRRDRSTPARSIRSPRSCRCARRRAPGSMSMARSACGRGPARSKAALADGRRACQFVGDRRAQMAADAVRLRLRHRARRRGASPRHDDRRELSAVGRRRRARSDALSCPSCRAARAASRPGRCCAISAGPASRRWSSRTAARPA